MSSNHECNSAISETALTMLCIFMSFSSFFIFEFLKSSFHRSNSTLCHGCYDNYLLGVTLEGAATQTLQSWWGVHERVMEDDINVLLSFYPLSKVSHLPL